MLPLKVKLTHIVCPQYAHLMFNMVSVILISLEKSKPVSPGTGVLHSPPKEYGELALFLVHKIINY